MDERAWVMAEEQKRLQDEEWELLRRCLVYDRSQRGMQ